jgi:hypothetical protein
VAEWDDTVTTSTTTGTQGAVARRRGPDPVALVIGLLTLGMAVAAFRGEVPSLAGLDARWLLAAGATGIGLLLLVGSLRGRKGS